MYRSSAFHILYFIKWKEEEFFFAKKNIKVPISAFHSAETRSQKNEKNKKRDIKFSGFHIAHDIKRKLNSTES